MSDVGLARLVLSCKLLFPINLIMWGYILELKYSWTHVNGVHLEKKTLSFVPGNVLKECFNINCLRQCFFNHVLANFNFRISHSETSLPFKTMLILFVDKRIYARPKVVIYFFFLLSYYFWILGLGFRISFAFLDKRFTITVSYWKVYVMKLLTGC